MLFIARSLVGTKSIEVIFTLITLLLDSSQIHLGANDVRLISDSKDSSLISALTSNLSFNTSTAQDLDTKEIGIYNKKIKENNIYRYLLHPLNKVL